MNFYTLYHLVICLVACLRYFIRLRIINFIDEIAITNLNIENNIMNMYIYL